MIVNIAGEPASAFINVSKGRCGSLACLLKFRVAVESIANLMNSAIDGCLSGGSFGVLV